LGKSQGRQCDSSEKKSFPDIAIGEEGKGDEDRNSYVIGQTKKEKKVESCPSLREEIDGCYKFAGRGEGKKQLRIGASSRI